MVTVGMIKDLILALDTLQIYVYGVCDAYEFPKCEIPEEILDMTLNSIDNPALNLTASPICLNLDIEDNFDDYDAFKEKYKDFLVN